ncbi:IclR family transcriptional regulator C-terminal domain-containing protein [Achromobacter insolitus]|jgi:IclR family pca regulon transcriptional regulator|nr:MULTISPECIES: IclR family transcriptional regulator C-terminal domain-containing protein [Achromobacter]MCP1402177.1 IclR family pca regulon transcriptional regulator [Achromobacter insolitus]MDH3063509.1 IclR family transcriptional regulator C-terminal domain-containing protein [Achromobacter insolitus]MEB3098508.1 IclR family transcriptional regulator C-terminal domain-containing protein [Achromobacter sp. D10]
MPKIPSERTWGLPKGGDQFVEAFARGLAVIRAFGPGHQALTLSEVAQRANLTPAGARRLLYTLVTLGYARTEERRFSLAPAVLELGYAYLSSLSWRDIARHAVEEFMRDTGEICTVSVLDGEDVVYVARAEMPSPLSRRLGVGERLPTHATSSGHVLLAGASVQERELFIAKAPFARHTQHTLVEAAELRQAIEDAAKAGYALASEHLELGICGLAVPIKDERGRVVAALTTSLNLARHERAEIVGKFLQKMRGTAEQISVALA